MQYHCDYCDREFNEYIIAMKHESNCKVVNLEKIILFELIDLSYYY